MGHPVNIVGIFFLHYFQQYHITDISSFLRVKLKRFRFFFGKHSARFFSGLYPHPLRSNSRKIAEITRKKAVTFLRTKRNLLSSLIQPSKDDLKTLQGTLFRSYCLIATSCRDFVIVENICQEIVRKNWTPVNKVLLILFQLLKVNRYFQLANFIIL